jgi:hypothetical protein
MSDLLEAGRGLSRRRFIEVGGAAAAAGALGPWLDAVPALGAARWPDGRLGISDARRVDGRQFMPVGQFHKWQKELDRIGPKGQRGLRATGSRAHEDYVEDLREDLERAGVEDVRFEPVKMDRWTTTEWSLELLGGTAAGPVTTAAYIPYSGRTPPGGVTGPLAFVEPETTPAPGSLAGKIAVFDVPLAAVPISFFTVLGYEGRTYDPGTELDPAAPYRRPYLGQDVVIEMLETLDPAGAVGAVGVLDYPFDGASGSYFPYDGILRNVPGIYLDRVTGAALKEQAAAGTTARLTLPAKVKRVKTRNLIGFIRGESRELVTLHCHTDGSNGIEDNGPAAIVAMSQYLARLPRRALPRTIMILLTTGHFAGGNGARAFRGRHADDLVKRSKAALTIEHLGLREWDELGDGRMGPTGRYEPGAVFAPGSEALVDASFAALERAKAAPSGVLRPLNPDASGDPNEAAWPGEGQYLFANGGIPVANYITGPTYLLNWGIKTIDKVDLKRARKEAIAFTEMVLRLGRTPTSELGTYTL